MWKDFYNKFRGQLQGENALYQASEQNRIERCFTFPNFERSAERCGQELEKAGLAEVGVEEFPADGKTTWYGWRAMKAWDVESARLTVTSPVRKTLQEWSVKPESLVMYSGPCECEGELVRWNGENDVDLADKIAFTHLRPLDVIHQMRALGVKGIVSDFIGTLPGVRDAFDLPDDVRWENYAFKKHHGEHWGFMVTPRQGKMLSDLLRQGPVRLRVEIKSRTYNGVMKLATGLIRGTDLGKEEILITSHLYEPGANDNASGAGLSLEIARSLNAAIEIGTIPRPRRSIRFIFNWEGFGLFAWAHKHRELVQNIHGGVNIDELGVDQAEGRSVLHLFMPPGSNNSCIGYLLEHLCEELLSPTLRWKAVADRPEIINDAITADPNIDIVLPTLIQYPSKHYHASSDRMDTLSAETMETLGNLCATHLFFLANSGKEEALYMSRIIAHAFQKKLKLIELRLFEGSYHFGYRRTRAWLKELFSSTPGSLVKFGLDSGTARSLREDYIHMVDEWCGQWKERFTQEKPRSAGASDIKRATSLVPVRTTPGIPMPPEIQLPPEEAQMFFDTLYGNNLDLVFFRTCYWADGKRSLMDIVELLEFEMDELYNDTSIARTGTGSLIDSRVPVEINLRALLDVADVITDAGFLRPL
jgi:hypothetical protein